jgi:hypothetical protein
MIVDRNATSVILHIRLLDTTNSPITGVAFNDSNLALEYMQPSDTGFAALTLTTGVIGTYASASWVEVGDGIYQFCPPDSFVVAGSFVTIRATYDIYPAIYDTLMATGNAGQVTIDMAQATPAGSTTGTQLDGIDASSSSSSTVSGSTQANSTAQWPDATLSTEVSNSGTFYYGDQWEFVLTGLSDIPTTEYLYFSLKTDPITEVDSSSVIQASRLLSSAASHDAVNYLNGSANSDATKTAKIAFDSYVDGAETKYKITVTLIDETTADVAAGTYYFDIKRVGAVSKVLERSLITVAHPVTRANQ